MTIRTAVLDALTIGAMLRAVAGLMLCAVVLVMAAIGTEKGEARPLLATVAWMRAHRVPLLGLLWPRRGSHLRNSPGPDLTIGNRQEPPSGPGDHPDDEYRQTREHMDDWVSGRFTHEGEDDDDGQPAETPARDRQPRAEEDDRAGKAQAHVAQEPPLAEARDAAAGEADDLTTGDDYDTDTLAIFHAANAEHLVPVHEPAQQPSGESGEPGAQAAAFRPFRRLPAADLDAMIEAARQRTVADPLLGEWIREALGFGSVDLYMDSMRRKLSAGAA